MSVLVPLLPSFRSCLRYSTASVIALYRYRCSICSSGGNGTVPLDAVVPLLSLIVVYFDDDCFLWSTRVADTEVRSTSAQYSKYLLGYSTSTPCSSVLYGRSTLL
jgi:hypothetical protein